METISLNKPISETLRPNSASPSFHISYETVKVLSSLLFCSGSIFAAYMHAQTIDLTIEHDVVYQTMCAIPPLLGAAGGALFVHSLPAEFLEKMKLNEESLKNIALFRDTANAVVLSAAAYAAPKYAWLPGMLLGFVTGGQMMEVLHNQSPKKTDSNENISKV